MSSIPVQKGGAELVAAAVTILVIETIFFVLRTASRAVSRASIGADDVILTISFPILVGLDACLIAMVYQGGAGWHVRDLIPVFGPNTVETFLKLQVAVAELYYIGVALPKLAILSLYLRIFTQKPIRIACRVLQVIMVAYPLAFFIGILAVCRPISALWLLEPPPGAVCGDLGAIEKYVSIPNIVTDVAILVLPMHAIWNLHLTKKDKFGVMIILGAGGMGLIVSCIRFAFWFREDLALTDITYVAITIGKFTCLEAAGYFVAACVPVLKPIVDYMGKIKPISSMRSLSTLFSKSRQTQKDSEAYHSDAKASDSSLTGNNNSVSVDGTPEVVNKPVEINGQSRNIEVKYDFSVTRAEH